MYLFSSLVVLLSLSWHSLAASDEKPAPKPCTIHSPTTGSFIDLRPLGLTRGGSGSSSQSSTNESYHAKGYDYPYNFTLNFCEPAVEELEDVTGVSSRLWSNVSAFYKDNHDRVFSIGQQNSELLFRGKKLLLNYTMGSPCPDLDEHGHPIPEKRYRSRALLDDDDDDDDDHDGGRSSHKAAKRRKNTMMIFSCDTSPLLSGRPAINFLGTPDHCTYTFEVRSRHACGGTTTHHESGTLGPGSVFLVISGIALLVYLIGGVVYQRNVMHQRGWRQLPNYALWAGLFGFVSDMTIILFGSCISRMPSLQRLFGGRGIGGYHRVGTDDYRDSRGTNGSAHGGRGSGGVGAGGRRGDSDAENRLIDSYDEEWDN